MTASVPDPAWHAIRAQLRQAVPEAMWHVWLEPLRLRSRDADTLVLEASPKSRDWIADRYTRVLQACATAVLGSAAVVEVVTADDRPAPVERAQRSPDLDPRLTFEHFVIGDSNRLAHAAALSVAENPGSGFNPLYICGPPGLGKTHLLHSIGNYVRAYAGLRVRYTTAEAFTNHFIAAIHGRRQEGFKAAYRGVDVLLVDDVQFLRSKAKTEEEFFHTFNTLHGGGAQIVLTSDRLPRDLGELEDRLRERFEAGLVCDVQPPDHLTRVTVLRKRAVQDGLDVDLVALERVACRVVSNVRALEGALIRVVAFGSLTRRPLSAELVDEVLDGLYPDLRPRAHTVRDVQECVCAAFGVELEELVSASRASALSWPRQLAMYLARELTGQSLPAIGSEFGGRRHTTVLHAHRKTEQRMASDADAFATVQRLTRELRGDHDRRA